MSRGFKIALVVLIVYCLLTAPFIWAGIKHGNLGEGAAPLYVGLLVMLLFAYFRRGKSKELPLSIADYFAYFWAKLRGRY